MKKDVVKQLKNLGFILYWLFVASGIICVGYGVFLLVTCIINNNIGEGIICLIISILCFGLLYLIAKIFNLLFIGYAFLVENTNVNDEILQSQKKIYDELLEIDKKMTTPKAVEIKEDISSIKKTTKIKPRESASKLDKIESNDNLKSKKVVSSEDIKERLAKAKGEVQKTMAVKSQVAANTISTSMLDDISDKFNIEQFETPEVYSQIDAELFKDCKNLEEVVITNNIKLIGAGAFHGCDALTTITIGNGVGVIEKSAFEGCNGLDKIIYKGSKKQWDEIVIQSGNEILKRVDITFEEK